MGLRTPNTKVNSDIRPEAGVEGNDCVTIRLHQVMVLLRVFDCIASTASHTHTHKERA